MGVDLRNETQRGLFSIKILRVKTERTIGRKDKDRETIKELSRKKTSLSPCVLTCLNINSLRFEIRKVACLELSFSRL